MINILLCGNQKVFDGALSELQIKQKKQLHVIYLQWMYQE